MVVSAVEVVLKYLGDKVEWGGKVILLRIRKDSNTRRVVPKVTQTNLKMLILSKK